MRVNKYFIVFLSVVFLLIIFLFIGLALASPDTLPDFSDETLPVLNEELRSMNKAIKNNEADDTAYDSTWDGDTDTCASKNALYDKIQTVIAGSLSQSKSFVITNPTASSDLPLWRAPSAATITAVHLNCKTQIIVGQLWEYDSNGLNGATVDSTDITGIVDTNVNDDGTLSNPSIASGAYVGWKTTSATAGATYAIVTFDYTVS